MNFLSKSLLNLLLLLATSTLFAQSDFEGKIDYSISYIDLPVQMKGYEAMLPKDMSITMKGNKSRVEQSQMMGSNVIVSDMDNKNGFIEMDMGGQKLRMLITTEEFESEENKALSNIEYLDETKDILGYACKKAIMITLKSAEEHFRWSSMIRINLLIPSPIINSITSLFRVIISLFRRSFHSPKNSMIANPCL